MADQYLSVSMDVPVTPSAVFSVLTDPAKHVELDGSGMLQLAHAPRRITGEGETFAIAMRDESGRPYEVVNHVVAYEADKVIAWMPARPDRPPVGVRWEWELTATEDGTRVTQTCDWSRVTDPDYLARRSLPRVSADKMRESITQVAARACR